MPHASLLRSFITNTIQYLKNVNFVYSGESDDEASGKPKFYNGDTALPVFKWASSKHHFSLEELGHILVTDSTPSTKQCTQQPTAVHHNVAFVVNLTKLNDYRDIRADENGVWKRNGAPVAFISVHNSGKTKKVVRRKTMKSHPNCFKLSRTYYTHSCSPDFHRIITVVYG